MAQNNKKVKCSAGIVAGNATYIGRIANDTLVVFAGGTYSFTIVTPEYSGLVSTKPGVKENAGT